MAESIKQILIRRDNITEQAANDIIDTARDALQEYLANDDQDSADNVCAEYFGLEADYLTELI